MEQRHPRTKGMMTNVTEPKTRKYVRRFPPSEGAKFASRDVEANEGLDDAIGMEQEYLADAVKRLSLK